MYGLRVFGGISIKKNRSYVCIIYTLTQQGLQTIWRSRPELTYLHHTDFEGGTVEYIDSMSMYILGHLYIMAFLSPSGWKREKEYNEPIPRLD